MDCFHWVRNSDILYCCLLQEKEKQKKQAWKKEMSNTTKVKEASKAKKQNKDSDASQKTATSPPNLLQVALTGSQSASHTSLGSISNGHLKNSSHDISGSNLQTPESDPKSIVQSPESPVSPPNSSANFFLNGKKTEADVGTPNVKKSDSLEEKNSDSKNLHITDEELERTVAIIDDIMDKENTEREEVCGCYSY